jgi:subtilisin family serine protease
MKFALRSLRTICGATAIAVLLSQTNLHAQEFQTVEPSVPGPIGQVVPGEYLIHFDRQDYDLSVLRKAIAAGVNAEVYGKLVGGIAAKAAESRKGILAEIEKRGGKLIENLWIVNVAWVRIADTEAAALTEIPGVNRVEQNLWHHLHIASATSNSHHASDVVNTWKNATNNLITGQGLAIAILDTGADANHNGSGRPHSSYYPGGRSTNQTGTGLGKSRLVAAIGLWSSSDTEDLHFHGTATAGCAASGGWLHSAADAGPSKGADIVSMKLTRSNSGGTTTAVLARGWQNCASLRIKHNIKVANASFGGSPSFTGADQMALDSAAQNADILITVSSGNSATNLGGTAATYNGLSVGSANKGSSRSLSSFSGRGTSSAGKTIPDIVAIGASVVMPRRDSETSSTSGSGTSFSSPLTAGAAGLVRQADPKLTALEAKAALLGGTEFGTKKYGYGAGYLRADLAVKRVLNGDVFTKRILGPIPKMVFTFSLTQGARHNVALAFNRTSFSSAPVHDLDLVVYSPSNQVVGTSAQSKANSYEMVAFIAGATGIYRAEVINKLGSQSASTYVDFAISGVGAAIPPVKPSLTAISPSSVEIFNGKTVTLTGKNLSAVSQVTVGKSTTVPVKQVTATTVTFDPPVGAALATVAVSVANSAGASNTVNMTYVPVFKPHMIGNGWLFTLTNYKDSVWAGPGNAVLVYMSGTTASSKIPGVIDLGIGNNFTNLALFTTVVTDARGEGSYSWTMPFGYANLSFYFQAVAIDPKSLKFPLITSQVLTRFVVL